MSSPVPHCKYLVLDAGPLLSLSPLRGLAETFITVPQVLAELKDARAREHFERLGTVAGVNVRVQSPDSPSLAHVTQFAKKTGDDGVLSHADLCILALTYMLHGQGKKEEGMHDEARKTIDEEPSMGSVQTTTSVDEEISSRIENLFLNDGPQSTGNSSDVSLEPRGKEAPHQKEPTSSRLLQLKLGQSVPEPIFDDPSDSDDGEGEWITPSNVGLHKSRALNLLPDGSSGKEEKAHKSLYAGCMTADFAMQNVLLQLGLNLVGLEGKRIESLKTWVLRCHACFKICKDTSKKFCPSCGNPTLLRASVTVSSPAVSSGAPAMQIHLKRNFQYKIRGTKYSIPSPKPGSAKTGAGSNLILREDQPEYMKAVRRLKLKKERQEARMVKGMLDKCTESVSAVSSWMDPDWVPEIVAVGTGGKGRTIRQAGMDGGLPQIGYGKKNPNERRRRK